MFLNQQHSLLQKYLKKKDRIRRRHSKHLHEMADQVYIHVSDFPEVSTTASQHYALVTLQCFIPRRLVNARQKFFWSNVQRT